MAPIYIDLVIASRHTIEERNFLMVGMLEVQKLFVGEEHAREIWIIPLLKLYTRIS